MKYLSWILVLLTFFACSQKQADHGASPVVKNVHVNGNEQMENEVLKERMLIRHARIRIHSEHPEKVRARLLEQLKRQNGYLVVENNNDYGSYRSIDLEMRIPASSLMSYINWISKNFYVKNKNTSTQDITPEYIDTEARLKNKKALEIRYLELLKQAKNVNEIMQIERELAKIRAEIEAAQGQLKYWRKQTEYALLSVTIESGKQRHKHFFRDITVAFKQGAGLFYDFLVGLIYLWPFLLIVSAVLFGFRIRRRKN